MLRFKGSRNPYSLIPLLSSLENYIFRTLGRICILKTGWESVDQILSVFGV